MLSRDGGPVERILDRLEGVQQRNGYHVARCPSHDDKNPSLSVKEGDDGRALLKCHARCETEKIINALDLKVYDLFKRRNGYKDGRNFESSEAAAFVVILLDLRIPGNSERVHRARAIYQEESDIAFLNEDHAVLLIRLGGDWGRP
jgi:hypothetical protein